MDWKRNSQSKPTNCVPTAEFRDEADCLCERNASRVRNQEQRYREHGIFASPARARIGEDEWMPFVVAGESVAPTSSLCTPSFTGRTPVPLSRTDESPNEFDVHTPGAPLVVEQIIRPTALLDPK